MRREDDPNDAVPDGKGAGEYRRESGPSGTTITLIVVGVLLLIFVLQNMNAANVDFLFWETDVSLGLALLIAAALGFVLGWGFAWLRRRARRLDRRADRRD